MNWQAVEPGEVLYGLNVVINRLNVVINVVITIKFLKNKVKNIELGSALRENNE